jgi:hypothetical protein
MKKMIKERKRFKVTGNEIRLNGSGNKLYLQAELLLDDG